MRRLERAILEIRSYRDCLNPMWPTDIAMIGLLNTCVATLQQVQALSKMTARERPNIDPKVDRTAEMIRQVNAEIQEDD